MQKLKCNLFQALHKLEWKFLRHPKTPATNGCLISVGDLTIKTSVSDYLSYCSMHQIFMHSRKCYTQNLEFDLSGKKCFFPHMVYCPSRVFWWQYVQLSWQPFRLGLIHSHFRSVSFFHLLLPTFRVFKKLQNLVTTKIWLANSTISQ